MLHMLQSGTEVAGRQPLLTTRSLCTAGPLDLIECLQGRGS